jgi:hypothetical protein
MGASTRLAVVLVTALVAGASASCETVDPGPGYVVMPAVYNNNYFYCVVEPQIIMGGLTKKPCGDDGSHGCHYSNKVPAFSLTQLTQPVTCSGSGITAVPTDMSQIQEGMPASNNLASTSFQMSSQYMEAPIYLWPTQIISDHPITVFSSSDTEVVNIIKTWSML